ncbi:hypothetical protein B0J13DRAFT_642170 [Dactylonectria estremocensis]|uniref:MARVEL domain-containing protein n=1 Tax=Dactylonectria estremocensis TaxID=1079267 RepID=A0A9P9E7N6_9HYPO|nr:hypothetical protein B0J13DRAFT_642170 [Dactylonectria estremocensis]
MASFQASSTGMWVSKLCLRICSIIFSVIIIAASAIYASNWTIGPIITIAPPAFVAVLWGCVEAICVCVSTGHYGVPHACAVLDLLLLLGFGAVTVLTGIITSKLSDSGFYIAYYQDEQGIGYLQVAVALGALATAVHIALFAIACYEIKNKGVRRVGPQPQIIYVQTGPNGEIMSSVPMAQMYQHPQTVHSDMEAPPMYSPPAEITPLYPPQEQMEIPKKGIPTGVGGPPKER